MLARLKFRSQANRVARLIALPALFFILFAVTQAAAQDKPAVKDEVAELFDYITAQKVVLGQTEKLEKTSEEALAADTKARAAIEPSAQSLTEQIKQKLLAFKPEADRRNAGADAIVENWNADCDVKRVGKLPPEKAEQCMRLRDEVDKTAAAIREQVKKDRLAFVGPQLLKAKQDQDKGLAELDDLIKKNTKARDEARAKATQIQAYLEQAHGRLKRLCLEAAEQAAASGDPHWRERLKYCESRGWDNAKKDLLPLTEIKPPFSASPN